MHYALGAPFIALKQGHDPMSSRCYAADIHWDRVPVRLDVPVCNSYHAIYPMCLGFLPQDGACRGTFRGGCEGPR